MNGLRILGTGRCLPASVVTNDDMSLRVDTSDEWIASRTGIRERRFCREETGVQLAAEAAGGLWSKPVSRRIRWGCVWWPPLPPTI